MTSNSEISCAVQSGEEKDSPSTVKNQESFKKNPVYRPAQKKSHTLSHALSQGQNIALAHVLVLVLQLLEEEPGVEDGQENNGDEDHSAVEDEEGGLTLHEVAAPAGSHFGNTVWINVSMTVCGPCMYV